MLGKSLMKKGLLPVAAGVSMVLASSAAWAHGESIRGGGAGSINAVGAAILEEKVLGLRWDARRYEVFTDQQMVDYKLRDEDVHMHSSEDAYFITYGFPVNEDMDIAIMWQYNNFKGFKDNGDDFANACFDRYREDTDGDGKPNSDGKIQPSPALVDCLSPTKESPGVGDTLVTGRYRFFNNGDHQFASVFGIIIPTGTITNRTDNGEIIGTHNQPGSGAITIQGGIAYSGHITEKVAVDADLIYRANTIGAKQFRPGNSTQFDVAISYGHHNKWTPVVELNIIDFKKDIEQYEVKKNSGGTSFYLSPGLTYRLSKNQSIYANYSFVYNKLGGISNDEKYRFSLGWSYGFGS